MTDRWAAVRRGPASGAHGASGTPRDDELPLCFAPVGPPADEPEAAPPEFGTVRRGYDPSAVDAYLGSLGSRLAAVETERQRADIAEDQLREALAELKRVRAGSPPADLATPADAADAAAAAAGDRATGPDAAALRAWEEDLRAREASLAEREREVDARISGAGSLRAAAADLERVHREIARLADVRRTVRAQLADLRRGLGHQLAAERDAGEPAVLREPVAPRQRTAGLPSRP